MPLDAGDGITFCTDNQVNLEDFELMMSHRSISRLRSLVIGLSLVLSPILIGCGADDGLGRRYPISGKVLVNDAPLAKGTINFIPEDSANGHAATGMIANGSYDSVTTRTPGDGILAGKYQVTISAVEDADLSAAQAASGPGVMDQVAGARAQAKAKPLVNPKYASPSTSGLSAEITGDKSTFDFSVTD